MNISIVGTGYVGLVTGVCLSEVGHNVTCIDIDEEKVKKMKLGYSPIFEPCLEELMKNNIIKGRLHFTTNYVDGADGAEIFYIAVGTPQKEDGSADLSFIKQAAINIARTIKNDVIIVVKSTVPVGTNIYIKNLILKNLNYDVKVDIISNPEFLREGSAVNDTFYGDRIVIGSENKTSANVMEEVYKPFGTPIFKTDIQSAEMIKYASNTFLATKISFINGIANLCEMVGADAEKVAQGMGQDKRIGSQFLNAGIGYGGSCFPKDTHALVKVSESLQHKFHLLESVIKLNKNQQTVLIEKIKKRFGSIVGKKIALLGLSFKPNTDDLREAPSIPIARKLVEEGAQVIAYDPVAIKNAREVLPKEVHYVYSTMEALTEADIALVLTEWDEVVDSLLLKASQLMKEPVIFDGRNCFELNEAKNYDVEYHSIGRPSVLREVKGEITA
ncbi:TPA: UDP-glucose/GDP-mannose dehydrogenase family protein [Bacillus anthracis]|nr:UDP-glucose/GDP-mannose dehydrogenase family protein [Bacillus anthracis]